MGMLNWFRRPPPIADREVLADFIDQHAAFVVQKGIYEYSSARAGHYAKVLFSEPEFLEAIEHSRWSAYPLGLAMLGELVEGVLRPHAGTAQSGQLDRLCALVLSVFDRYPVPSPLTKQAWSEARDELARRLQLVGLHPPKHAKDIPEPYAKTYWDLMPIHKDLRTRDFATTHNYLKATMCNIHAELTQRLDVSALTRSLNKSDNRS